MREEALLAEQFETNRAQLRAVAYRMLGSLTEADDAVPDDVWDDATDHFDEQALAALVLAIATVNLWNRLNAATRQVAGAWAA